MERISGNNHVEPMFRRRKMPVHRIDLALGATPDIDWNDGPSAKLDSMYQSSIRHVIGVIEWYMRAKRYKRLGARIARMAVIVLGSTAALLPTIAELIRTRDGTLSIPAGWTAVAFGIGGALIVVDRFFGFSTGWMRYITAELHLRQILHEFRIDWESERALWRSEGPDATQVANALARLKALIIQVNTIVREETLVWVNEFASAVQLTDDHTKVKRAGVEPGALNVTIANGDKADDGWLLTIDDSAPERHAGRTASFRNLSPGAHQVRAVASVNGSATQASKIISVLPGGVCELRLELE
jgi:hypothetical protein